MSNTDNMSNTEKQLTPQMLDVLEPNKSANRVHKSYIGHPEDWLVQYNMLLPDNVTCGDCKHAERCEMLFGGDDKNTSCQFHPSRFNPILKTLNSKEDEQ